MPGSYPYYHSLTEKMAAKVITRVVQDGIGLDDAIKEAVNFADLNRQQIIHMCSILQDYGMVYNGSPKNYFTTSTDMGKAFPNTEDGYVVYANAKKDPNRQMKAVFAAVDDLKEQGLSNDEILDINPELEGVLQIMDEFQDKYFNIIEDTNETVAPPQNIVEFPGQGSQPELEMAANDISSRVITAQELPPEEVDVAKPTPENIEDIMVDEEPAGEDDLGAAPEGEDAVEFTDEVSEEEDLGGGSSVTLTQDPSYFTEKASATPAWDVDNILSIEQARNYLDNLKKEMEEVVFNDKIQIGKDLLAKFDESRASIDEQLNKIKDAQKQTEKLEDKKEDIEEEFAVDEPGPEAPTEELVAEDPAPVEEDFGGEELEVSENPEKIPQGV